MGRNGKIYIIPTRFGLVFFAGIVIMLLVGATYANNLVNLLAFFLLAIALVAMVQTHNNLKNIRLQAIQGEAGFSGSTVNLIAALENTGNMPRFNLEIRAEKLGFQGGPEQLHPLQGRSILRFKGAYEAPERGRHRIGRIRVSTIYPLGLFYSWTWLKTDASYVIYPAPKGDRPLPSTKFEAYDGPVAISARGGDDFRGHREFRTGDSARRIDWKARARGRPLLVKEFDEGDPAAILFDYGLMHGLSREARLSQLTIWISRAKLQRLTYALRLPHVTIPAGDDLRHYERCLEELALFPKVDSDETAS